jgi:hypothetical protein
MAREGSLRLFYEAHNPLHNQTVVLAGVIRRDLSRAGPTASAALNQEGYRP